MTLRRKMLAMAGAVALTLTIAVTAVAAGGPLGALAAPGGSGTTGQDRMADFLSKLAANLGISQDQLNAAIKTTDLQQIDAAVAAGQMTADEANAARDRVNNSPNGTPPFGIGGGRGGDHGGGPGGKGGMNQGALLEAGAAYFGISTDQLRQDLTSAGSWQGVAAKYGKDTDAGKAGLRAALEAALRQQLTDRGLDAAQIDQQVNQFTQNFDQFYTQQGGARGPRGPQMPSPSASPTTTP